MIGAGAFNLDGAIINGAEARGFKEGLIHAMRRGFKKIMVEGDSSSHSTA